MRYRTLILAGAGFWLGLAGCDRSPSLELHAQARQPMLGDDLVVDNETITLSGLHRYDSIRVINGGVIDVADYDGDPNSGRLILEARERIEIDASSSINANRAGFAGGQNSDDDGAGPGGGEAGSENAGGGGGHAAPGGDGTDDNDCSETDGQGGASYGDAGLYSVSMGSGGGAAQDGESGGNGGGAVILKAPQIIIAGEILARGEDGEANGSGWFRNDAAGGGAGGGVLLIADSLDCSGGRINVRGGDGGNTDDDGGGGGGGWAKQTAGSATAFCDAVLDGGDSECNGGQGSSVTQITDGSPLISLACGDGVVNAWEACDDGNITSGDGCSSSCRLERGFSCLAPTNLLTNGGFASGATGFSSDASAAAGDAPGNGEYQVDITPRRIGYCPFGNCLDVNADGAGALWQQTVAVQPNTQYRIAFAYFIADFDASSAALEVRVDGSAVLGPLGPRPSGGWQRARGSFATDDETEITLSFVTTTTSSSGNTVALDALALSKAQLCDVTCGDGIVAGPEQCDDAQQPPVGDDGCDAACSVEAGYACRGEPSECASVCGNGTLNPGEECDDGNPNSGDGCSSRCVVEAGYVCPSAGSPCVSSCGNGNLEAGEACDDGNSSAGDGCSESCQIEPGFVCSGSPSQCAFSCGDAQKDPGEECDDGNLRSGDGCDNRCQIETAYACAAPDSQVELGGFETPQVTDDDSELTPQGWSLAGGNSVTLRANLAGAEQSQVVDLRSSSGSGSIFQDLATTPDTAYRVSFLMGSNATCGSGERSFELVVSEPGGDEVARRSFNPTADAGSELEAAGLTFTATTATTRLRFRDTSGANADTCGPVIDRVALVSTCAPTCGNARLDAGEQCDDGSKQSGDGCSDTCRLEPGFACEGEPSSCAETCGNGGLDAGEACDDGNSSAGDGCSESCQQEPGYSCSTPGAPCEAAACGDGVVAGGERCDDGNSSAGDGCDDTGPCTIEPGYSCAGSPSVCAQTCGDGRVDVNEECDDGGGAIGGDGCTATCRIELGYTCSGSPSACVTICGDGQRAGSEGCDDGNTSDNDGCTAECLVELGAPCSRDRQCLSGACFDAGTGSECRPDQDQDGRADAEECASFPNDCPDTDGDGIADPFDPADSSPEPGDSDSDGIDDASECPSGARPCRDTDADGTPNYLDDDDDGDGVPTGASGETPQADIDADAIPDHLDPDDTSSNGGDSDADGVGDVRECSNTWPCRDTDGDGVADYLDTDDDGDASSTASDGEDANANGDPVDDDSDGDGIPNYLDPEDAGTTPGDSDADGRDDSRECPGGWPCVDTDGDRIPDYMDSDGDADGIADVDDPDATDACVPDNSAAGCDIDGDGTPNGDDEAPSDACVPSIDAAGCDADGDGFEGPSDPDNSDPCVPELDAAGCDADGDEVDGPSDPDNADPCVPSIGADACTEGGADSPLCQKEPYAHPNCDPDADGLSNRIEELVGSDNATADTDGDGLADGREVELGTDPTQALFVSGGGARGCAAGAASPLVVAMMLGLVVYRRRKRWAR